jgi:catechol 2,3-dioxygenase-like lactoylglutathione lyase family enzyme
MGSNSARQHLCLEVDDLEAFRQRLVENGYEPRSPESITNRPRLFVRDPFDNLLELVEIHGDYD